jgi:hypothetical protein
MSMSHKAYAFDWNAFTMELRPTLDGALVSGGDANPLFVFIDTNLERCSDPNEGNPLASKWKDALHGLDVLQEAADYALTKYYDPRDDHGLGTVWLTLVSRLPAAESTALLGVGLTIGGRLFDPGAMGSYFQTPAMVAHNQAMLHATVHPELIDFQRFLQAVHRGALGLYVTF